MGTPDTRFEHSKDKLMEDLRAVVADAEELVKATASQTGERISTARARAEESLLAAKARLADVQAAAVERAKEAAKSTDDYVRDNPWQAIGVAAAIGLAIGVMISRR